MLTFKQFVEQESQPSTTRPTNQRSDFRETKEQRRALRQLTTIRHSRLSNGPSPEKGI